jgi:hypothetical protein
MSSPPISAPNIARFVGEGDGIRRLRRYPRIFSPRGITRRKRKIDLFHEIAGANTDPPAIPVEETYVITARLWQEDVPHMRIAVKDGHIAVRVVALIQTVSAVDQALVDVPALRRQAVADTIGEPLKFLRSREPLMTAGSESGRSGGAKLLLGSNA